MIWRSKLLIMCGLLLSGMLLACEVSAETWANSQRLNPVSETWTKMARICGSSDGGFHAVYRSYSPSDKIKYRRYSNGVMGNVVTIYNGDYNMVIAEALNGDIHIVWENWNASGIPIGHAISTDGGVSFSTNSIPCNNTKFPQIAPYGTGNSPTMLCTAGSIDYPNTSDNNMRYATYNGSTWNGTHHLDNIGSEYQLMGIGRDPSTGHVYKLMDDDRLFLKKWNGSSWSSEIFLETNQTFRCRHDLAVNQSGQVMAIYSKNESTHVKLWDPTNGVIHSTSFLNRDFPKVEAIPYSNDFYLIYVYENRVYGRKYRDGSWSNEVVVSQGLASGFYPDCDLTVTPNGKLYAAFELWENMENPQWFWTECDDFERTPPSYDYCGITSSTLMADGTTNYTVVLACSDTNGVSQIKDMRVLFNLDTETYDESLARGYMAWGETENDITRFGGTWNIQPCSSGGGYWGYLTDGWGCEYITPVSAVTTAYGNQRTVQWTFRVNPLWAQNGPLTGNTIGVWVADSSGLQGWDSSDNLWGYTFNVQAPVSPVASFTAYGSDGKNYLHWTNPSTGDFSSTMIRFKTTGYPTNPTDGTLVCDKTGTLGSTDSFTHTGLTNGTTYYYAAFARSSSGSYASSITASATSAKTTCGSARVMADGAVVDLTEAVVTAAFPAEGCVYVEDIERTAGVRIVTSRTDIVVGDVLHLRGTVGTRSVNGVACERQITPSSLHVVAGTTVIDPLAMNSRSLGGGPIGSFTAGTNDGFGLNNLGLLVRVAGKVESVSGNTFILSDGGADGNVLVICPAAPAVSQGDIVAVTGVAEGYAPVTTVATGNWRCIRIRTLEDIDNTAGN